MQDEDKLIKKYRISYGKRCRFLKYIVEKVITLMCILFICICLCIITIFALRYIHINHIVIKCLVGIELLLSLLTAILSFFPRYVRLDDCKVTVDLVPFIFQIKIPYSKIKYIDEGKRFHYRYLRYGIVFELPLLAFSDTVMISTGFTKYLLSVEDCNKLYDDIDDCIDRLDFLKSLNIDELLVSKGIDYNAVKLRWDSDGNLQSAYCVDEDGKEFILVKFNNKKTP